MELIPPRQRSSALHRLMEREIRRLRKRRERTVREDEQEGGQK